MSDIVSVIEKLSERFQSENDISDITYTLLCADDDFKKVFLNTIFEGIKTEDILYIQRELPEEDSRPDFIMETSNDKYLIEVKKWDRNHHFEQYKNTFPNYNRAYITNYELGDEKIKYKNDYIFFTWKEIYENLSKINSKKENKVVAGYLKYLKNVCGFMEIKDMRFDNLNNLAQFNIFVNEIIISPHENLICSPYNTKYNFSSTYSGSYFSLKTKTGEKVIYPWFGVEYSEDTKIQVIMEFDTGWCSILKAQKEKIYTAINNKNNTNCKIDNNGIYVTLKDDYFKKLQNENDVDKQKEILKSFFDDTILGLETYLN